MRAADHHIMFNRLGAGGCHRTPGAGVCRNAKRRATVMVLGGCPTNEGDTRSAPLTNHTAVCVDVPPWSPDVALVAAAAFLARYSGRTLEAQLEAPLSTS